MEQKTPEWYAARKGKLTGSNVGAALGVNPWKTPEALIRQMVREYHGAESEFTGNIATEHGTTHEPMALLAFEDLTGHAVQGCGFIVHPEHEWLGASPDGLINDDLVVEIKCPFGQRDKAVPEFKSAKEQPHYYAQMQVEMACTGRKACAFFQWSQHGSKLETVEFCPEWWEKNLPEMQRFFNWYQSELDNPAHIEPLLKEVNTNGARLLIDEYQALTEAIEQASERKKEVLEELVQLAKGRNALVHGRKLTQVERKGNVNYSKIPQLKGLDLEPFRGKPSKYWRLS